MPLKQGNSIANFDMTVAQDPSFFRGSPNWNNLNWDPLITGYAFVNFVRFPKWVAKAMPGAKEYLEKFFKSFQGLSDLELQTSAMPYGFAANEYQVAANMQKQNTEFTLRFEEMSGSPVRRTMEYWISGIRDPETGVATYAAKFGIDYMAKNHTGDLLYILTRPDANNIEMNNIEFACYYTAVMPSRIPYSHLNYEQGQHEVQPLEIPFKGVFHRSPQVDEYAKLKMKEVYAIRPEGSFTPFGYDKKYENYDGGPLTMSEAYETTGQLPTGGSENKFK